VEKATDPSARESSATETVLLEASRLATLARAALLLNRESDVRRALAEALPLFCQVFGAAAGWVTMRVGEGFELVAATGLPPALEAGDRRELRWSPCRCQRMALAGELTETAIVLACERLARLREQLGDHQETGGLAWHLSVPLRLPSGQMLGVLNLAYRSPPHLDSGDKAVLDLVGELLAATIERTQFAAELARLRSDEQIQATHLAQQLVGLSSVVEVADALFAALEPVLEPDATSLLAIDPSGQFLVLRAARGWAADWVGRLWLPLEPPTHNGPAWSLHTGHPFIIRPDQPDRLFPDPEPVPHDGVRLSAFFPLYADRQPIGVIVANYCTVRSVSEEQLRFAELLCQIAAVAIARTLERERNEQLISDLPVGVFQLDQKGNIVQANRALTRLLGWERSDDLQGRSFLDVFSDRKEAQHWLRRLREEGVLVGTEYRWRQRDGKLIWVRLSGRAERAPEGQLLLIEGTVEDISERKSIEDHLAYLARHDALTGIANRYALFEALEKQIARAMRSGQAGALLLFDLDNFKAINDRLGHIAGDSALRAVANRLATALRSEELAARLGGDEFAAVISPVSPQTAESVARRLLATIAEITVPLPDRVIHLSASCGIALFPEHGTTVEELLIAADRALYAAKYRGRARAEVYKRATSAAEQPAAHLTTLQSALQTANFRLLAQPIMDLRCSRITGYEVLLRLRDGDHTIDPDLFLPIAERLGMMPHLDAWVIERVLELDLTARGRIHVNLSAQTLRDRASFRSLMAMLERTAIRPGKLVFEVTETAALIDFEQVRERLEELRARGCRVALDDFGVGYSCLYQFRALPIDFLKIDGNFIVNLPGDPFDQSIIKAMVELTRAVRVETIAEWVETEETLVLLRQLGVDYAQGFTIGRPQPIDSL